MNHLLLDLTETPMSILQNWRQIIAEIESEFNRATITDYRVALLSLFTVTMDIAETHMAPEALGRFKEDRLKYYRSFLVQEARVGQHICTQTLDEVTQREVAAGRMDADDELRKTAVLSLSMPHLSRAELMEMEPKKRPQTHRAGIMSSIGTAIQAGIPTDDV
jgi:hypothetical protein